VTSPSMPNLKRVANINCVYLGSTQAPKKTETEADFSIVWGLWATQVKNSSHLTTRKLPSSGNIFVKLFTHKMLPYPTQFKVKDSNSPSFCNVLCEHRFLFFVVERDCSFCVFFSFALKIGFLWGFVVFGLWVFLFSLGLLQRRRFRLWVFAFIRSSWKKEK
jgi:hypothetical protein